VGRIRYDLGNENFIGALGLSRNFTEANNYLGGLDWSFKFWKNWYFQGELFLSNTKELNDSTIFYSERQLGSTGHDAGFDGEQYYGTGMHLALQRRGRNYTFFIVQNNFSPTYQTYNGMYPSVNSRRTSINNSYTFYPNKKIIKKVSVNTGGNLNYNYDGMFKELVIQPGASLSMIGQTNINFAYLLVNRERFREVFFKGVQRAFFNISSAPVRGLSVSLNGQAGRFIYRTLTPVVGKGYTLSSSVSIEPTSRLKSSFTCSLARLNDLETDEEFYNGFILRNSTTFQFSRKLFLRNITQYNSFSNTFSIYPLISYKFNAFTMFCAGMTKDMLEYEEEDYIFKPTENQFFVKLQYLFSK